MCSKKKKNANMTPEVDYYKRSTNEKKQIQTEILGNKIIWALTSKFGSQYEKLYVS